MLSRPLIEDYCGRDGGIQRFGARVHRNGKRDIACSKRLFADASALIADDKHSGCVKCFRVERGLSTHLKAVDPKPFLFKHLERVIYVADGDEWDAKRHTGRDLNHPTSNARLIVFGY